MADMSQVYNPYREYSNRFDINRYGERDDVDVYDTFYDEFTTDNDCETDRLHWLYTEATPEERAIIDQVLICLCGYSYPTLVEKSIGIWKE